MAKDESSQSDDGAAKRREPYSGPAREALRKALAALVTGGLVPDNVVERGGDLLALEIVASRMMMPEEADRDNPDLAVAEEEGERDQAVTEEEDERDQAVTEALVAVLTDAVEKNLLFRRHRRLLRCVLPLRTEYLDKNIEERRAAAGEYMMKKAVKAGTIRTYYEPRALDELARVLVEMEAKHRGEVLSDLGV
jgi:hypothetical protein